MAQHAAFRPPAVHQPHSLSRADWLYRSLVAGFVATACAGLVLLIAYAVANLLGHAFPGIIGQWFLALTRNQATALVQDALARALLVHIAVGLIFALVYAAVAEPRLAGPGWRRGMLFALIPWILSLVVFLPLVGGGFLGLALGAGPLPIIGNFILHMAYGATLGELYELETVEATEAGDEALGASSLANISAERGLAAGMIAGGLIGAVLGLAFAAVFGNGAVPETVGALAGIVFGSAAGAMVGYFSGLSRA